MSASRSFCSHFQASRELAQHILCLYSWTNAFDVNWVSRAEGRRVWRVGVFPHVCSGRTHLPWTETNAQHRSASEMTMALSLLSLLKH